jgi:hypothetical protein
LHALSEQQAGCTMTEIVKADGSGQAGFPESAPPCGRDSSERWENHSPTRQVGRLALHGPPRATRPSACWLGVIGKATSLCLRALCVDDSHRCSTFSARGALPLTADSFLLDVLFPHGATRRSNYVDLVRIRDSTPNDPISRPCAD